MKCRRGNTGSFPFHKGSQSSSHFWKSRASLYNPDISIKYHCHHPLDSSRNREVMAYEFTGDPASKNMLDDDALLNEIGYKASFKREFTSLSTVRSAPLPSLR